MSNTTVNDFTEMTSPDSNDILYIVRPTDSTKDYKIKVSTLKTKIKSESLIDVSASGSLSVSNDIITLTVGLSVINLVLPNGTENQELLIIGKSLSSNAVITPTNFTNTSITFTLTGQTIKLKFISGKWYVLSNNGTTIS